MGIIKNRYILPVVLAALFLIPLSLKAQKVVVDAKTSAQVLENMVTQLAIEKQHNDALDTIQDKQEQILQKTSAIYAAKELTLLTLQNVKGFEVESMYYKEITNTSLKISDLSTKVLKSLTRKSTLINKANAVAAVYNLVARSTQCVCDFVNIVTNCTVANPLKKVNSENINEKKDSHNLLDRYERMGLAAQITYDLKRIKNQLTYIDFLCNYGDWSTLVNQIDSRSWANFFHGKSVTDRIVHQWKQIKK